MRARGVFIRRGSDRRTRALHQIRESDRPQQLIDIDARRRRWYEATTACWPEYAKARGPGPTTLDEIGALLGIG